MKRQAPKKYENMCNGSPGSCQQSHKQQVVKLVDTRLKANGHVKKGLSKESCMRKLHVCKSHEANNCRK